MDFLFSNKVVRKRNVPIKVLGRGDIKSAITIKTDKITKHAEEKIKNAGGVVNLNG
jgi:large subunit ribosomal protein L15